MATEAVAAPSALRQCQTCGLMKAPSAFYASNKSHCRDCIKARVTQGRRENPAVQAYDRERAKSPHRRAKAVEITRRWRQETPGANAAHVAVQRAVASGALIRSSCLFCGEAEVHAHHKDYSKPLDVVWLCAQCHRRLHSVFPEAGAA